MTPSPPENSRLPLPSKAVLVWDLPTRLFHWSLVLLVIFSFVTEDIGGNAMHYHELSGFTILGLLLFRIIWGIVGSAPSRFQSFLRAPAAVLQYAATTFRRDSECLLTHNSLGGWSVAAMLAALLVQAGTGLFANDDIATEGPLYKMVSKATSDALTEVHELNAAIIVALVILHLAAVFFHLIYKRDNLLLPMITGNKPCAAIEPPKIRPLWMALIVAAASAAGVYFLVR